MQRKDVLAYLKKLRKGCEDQHPDEEEKKLEESNMSLLKDLSEIEGGGKGTLKAG